VLASAGELSDLWPLRARAGAGSHTAAVVNAA